MYGQDPNRGYAPYYPAGIRHPETWQDAAPAQPAAVTPAPPQPPHVEPKKPSTTTTSAPPCDVSIPLLFLAIKMMWENGIDA